MVLIASLTDSEGWEEEQQRRSRGRYSSSLISEIFCRLSIPTGYLMLPFLILRQLAWYDEIVCDMMLALRFTWLILFWVSRPMSE